MKALFAEEQMDTRFAAVGRRFEQYLESDGYSGQLAVWWRGKPVVDIAGGPELTPDSVTGVFSVSKGVAALVIATLIDDGRLELDAPVARYWPEFSVAGKSAITVRQLLSHQAGLPGIEGKFEVDLLLESGTGAAALAQQAPLWVPGQAFGYHALTIGILMEELVRRVTGATLQEVYELEIRAPRGADFYLGLPESSDDRYVPVGEARLTPEQLREVADLGKAPADGISALALGSFGSGSESTAGAVGANNARMRRIGASAVGGVGSARGLARLFSDALPGASNPIARPETFALMSQLHSWGLDRVLHIQNAFGVIFMLPHPRMPYAGHRAFGHDGAGGALAFADPESEMSFGYIPAPMQYPGGADRRAIELARLARDCAMGYSS
ncbi:serine hydrolase domain-containing protein [Paenarthrobacter sp. NPDC091669]|uniref:serine hydrolase domain-containing protein n=1 Tax=Paenarthrobacter sp. NPDC091669 TaxID=3364384 RepID=UPI0037F18F4E